MGFAPQQPLDLPRLEQRARHYAAKAGARQETLDTLAAFLRDPLTRAVLELPQESLEAFLVNDAYKPRMHKLYACHLPGVVTDFELAVRRTPFPLARIQQEDPELWAAFQARCAARLRCAPYPPDIVAALGAHFAGFSCSEEMVRRGEQHGVAPLDWRAFPSEAGELLVAYSHGPIEASSHVETTLTQAVQEVTIEAQVRALARLRGVRLAPTELLANTLGKLAAGVQLLSDELLPGTPAAAAAAGPQEGGSGGGGSGGGAAASGDGDGSGGAAPQLPGLMLFAGRRSSSRRFLLLQNLYCMRYLPGYQGTSSVLAVTLLDRLSRQLGTADAAGAAAGSQAAQAAPQDERQQQQQREDEQQQGARQAQPWAPPSLRLVGTLAHEVMMVVDQLLGCYDDLTTASASSPAADSSGGGGGGGEASAGGGGGSPAQICSLLAHLLLVAAGGGLAQATALCDTFGTRGFVSAALAARLPAEFRQDMQAQYPDEWAALPAAARAPGARVFDLFSTWRMDSGDYAEMASYVVDAWEVRWAGVPPGQRPPRPRLMHSNLESWEQILEVWRLPPRIRPSLLAFGTLADGFVPFDTEGTQEGQEGEAVEVQPCSVVMKAVQSVRPGSALPLATESAGKLGDDVSSSKAQFDRRLPPEAVERTRRRLLALSAERRVDPEAASAALRAAYRAVTRDKVLH